MWGVVCVMCVMLPVWYNMCDIIFCLGMICDLTSPPRPRPQVIGLALIGLAIYLLATQNDLTVLTGNRFASGGVLILIAGLITTIISFVGVLGAIGMWPVLLIIVSSVEIVACVKSLVS